MTEAHDVDEALDVYGAREAVLALGRRVQAVRSGRGRGGRRRPGSPAVPARPPRRSSVGAGVARGVRRVRDAGLPGPREAAGASERGPRRLAMRGLAALPRSRGPSMLGRVRARGGGGGDRGTVLGDDARAAEDPSRGRHRPAGRRSSRRRGLRPAAAPHARRHERRPRRRRRPERAASGVTSASTLFVNGERYRAELDPAAVWAACMTVART